jgi:hypothetical protein
MIFLFVEENLSSSVYKKVHHSESIFFFSVCGLHESTRAALFFIKIIKDKRWGIFPHNSIFLVVFTCIKYIIY